MNWTALFNDIQLGGSLLGAVGKGKTSTVGNLISNGIQQAEGIHDALIQAGQAGLNGGQKAALVGAGVAGAINAEAAVAGKTVSIDVNAVGNAISTIVALENQIQAQFKK